MSEITETEIKSMTKEQNYMRGYRDGKSDALDKIRAEIIQVIAEESTEDLRWALGLKYSIKIIDKYKAEIELKKSEEAADEQN